MVLMSSLVSLAWVLWGCTALYLFVAEREQLCVFEMLCTDSRHGRFLGGLDWDWDVCRCSRNFYAANADGHKRKCRLPCDPRTERIERKCMAQSGIPPRYD
jgi:hypothetical protein